MNLEIRERLRLFLRTLADSHVTTMRLLEQTLLLLSQDLTFDSAAYFTRYVARAADTIWGGVFQIDRPYLLVRFQKKTCFRYSNPPADGEIWIDFHQLQAVIDKMVQAIEQ